MAAVASIGINSSFATDVRDGYSPASVIPPTATWSDVVVDLPAGVPAFQTLTPAERVIVAQVRYGLSNREIARALGKSEATVKNQVAACLHKCGVPTRGRLMALVNEGVRL